MLATLLAVSLGTAPAAYDQARVKLDSTRQTLATQWSKDKAGTRKKAKQALLEYLDGQAFPAWSGTPWAFSGTSTTPKEGTIACGYFSG
jgi:hypothetical protein